MRSTYTREEYEYEKSLAEAKEALLEDREPELTEFERKLEEILYYFKYREKCTSSDKAKEVAVELLSIARKQIISEIEPEQLTENFKQYVLLKEANGCDGPLISLGTDCYKRGIKHCLDEIELKDVVKAIKGE